MQVPVVDQLLTLTGRTDFRTHRSIGWFVVTDDDVPSYGLIAWDLRSVALLPGDHTEVPAELPAQGWETRPIDATSSTSTPPCCCCRTRLTTARRMLSCCVRTAPDGWARMRSRAPPST